MATSIDLTTEFQLWCKNNGMPQKSADDLLLCPDLTYTQRIYLQDFIRRWEKADEY
jgi:hypothetical protein